MRMKTKRAIRRGLKAGGFYDTRGLYSYVHEKTGLNDRRRGIKKKKELDPRATRIFIVIFILSIIALIVVYTYININNHLLHNGFSIKNIDIYEIDNNYYIKGNIKNKGNKKCKSGNVSIYVKEDNKHEFVVVYLDKFPKKNSSLDFDTRIAKPHTKFNDPIYSLYKVDCLK